MACCSKWGRGGLCCSEGQIERWEGVSGLLKMGFCVAQRVELRGRNGVSGLLKGLIWGWKEPRAAQSGGGGSACCSKGFCGVGGVGVLLKVGVGGSVLLQGLN